MQAKSDKAVPTCVVLSQSESRCSSDVFGSCSQVGTKRVVYENLATMMRVVSPGKLQAFLESGLTLPFSARSVYVRVGVSGVRVCVCVGVCGQKVG